jgi:ferric-chelate reductase
MVRRLYRKVHIQIISNANTSQAFSQIPLIIGLASKNNVIAYLTGISYQKLNYLHRASGRACLLLSYVHMIGRVKLG